MKLKSTCLGFILLLVCTLSFGAETNPEYTAAILCANHIAGYLNNGFIDHRYCPIWNLRTLSEPRDPDDAQAYSNFPNLRNDVAVLPAPHPHMVYVVTGTTIYKQTVESRSDVLQLPQISKPIYLSAQNEGVIVTETPPSFRGTLHKEVPHPTNAIWDKQAIYGEIYNLMQIIQKRDKSILGSLVNYDNSKTKSISADSFKEMSLVRSNERRILLNNCSKIKDTQLTAYAQKLLSTLPELSP